MQGKSNSVNFKKGKGDFYMSSLQGTGSLQLITVFLNETVFLG